jgi:hypothetical protein
MKLLAFGILLLGASAYPLILMGRELAVGLRVDARYQIQLIPNTRPGMMSSAIEAKIAGHSVQLTDDQAPTNDRSARVVGPVRILIDGRDHSHPVAVTIRPGFSDDNRYWGYVHVTKLLDRAHGTQQLVVAQNIGRGQYRLLSTGPTGGWRKNSSAMPTDARRRSERC